MATARPAGKTRRFGVSMRPELVQVLDTLARERGVSRSEVLAGLTVDAERRRRKALMAEGQREMAALNRQFADEALPAAAEVMLRHG